MMNEAAKNVDKDMTRLGLLDAIVSRLKSEFLGCSLPNKNGVLQDIAVFSQWLPQGKGISFETREVTGLKSYSAEDYAANFPCIIVRLDDLVDTEEGRLPGSTVGVKIVTGIYDEAPECQGYRDILDMQEVIRRVMLTERVFSKKYVLRFPMKSRLLDMNEWPIWYGEQELTFELGRPVQNWDYVHGGLRRPPIR